MVVPQYLGRPEFVEQLEHLAREVGAEFHEIVLLDGRDNVLRRFAERTRAAVDPAHAEAQQLSDRSGGVTELAAMYDRLVAMLASRPGSGRCGAGRGDRTRRTAILVVCLASPHRAGIPPAMGL